MWEIDHCARGLRCAFRVLAGVGACSCASGAGGQPLFVVEPERPGTEVYALGVAILDDRVYLLHRAVENGDSNAPMVLEARGMDDLSRVIWRVRSPMGNQSKHIALGARGKSVWLLTRSATGRRHQLVSYNDNGEVVANVEVPPASSQPSTIAVKKQGVLVLFRQTLMLFSFDLEERSTWRAGDEDVLLQVRANQDGIVVLGLTPKEGAVADKLNPEVSLWAGRMAWPTDGKLTDATLADRVSVGRFGMFNALQARLFDGIGSTVVLTPDSAAGAMYGDDGASSHMVECRLRLRQSERPPRCDRWQPPAAFGSHPPLPAAALVNGRLFLGAASWTAGVWIAESVNGAPRWTRSTVNTTRGGFVTEMRLVSTSSRVFALFTVSKMFQGYFYSWLEFHPLAF